MFGSLIFQVFELVDNDHVTVLKSSSSNKVLIQVLGKPEKGEMYYISPGKSICQCSGYLKGKKDYCKHILAAHIILSITTPEEYEVIAESEIINIFHTYISKKKKWTEETGLYEALLMKLRYNYCKFFCTYVCWELIKPVMWCIYVNLYLFTSFLHSNLNYYSVTWNRYYDCKNII